MADVTSTCRQASIDATRCENTFEANKMFGNAILDARDDARDSPRQKRMERKPVRDRLSRRQHLRLRSAVRVR